MTATATPSADLIAANHAGGNERLRRGSKCDAVSRTAQARSSNMMQRSVRTRGDAVYWTKVMNAQTPVRYGPSSRISATDSAHRIGRRLFLRGRLVRSRWTAGSTGVSSTEGAGFEPARAFRPAGFQDRCISHSASPPNVLPNCNLQLFPPIAKGRFAPPEPRTESDHCMQPCGPLQCGATSPATRLQRATWSAVTLTAAAACAINRATGSGCDT